MPWQYLPDCGVVCDEQYRTIAQLAPDVEWPNVAWHNLDDDERARWDRIGAAIARLGDDAALA